MAFFEPTKFARLIFSFLLIDTHILLSDPSVNFHLACLVVNCDVKHTGSVQLELRAV